MLELSTRLSLEVIISRRKERESEYTTGEVDTEGDTQFVELRDFPEEVYARAHARIVTHAQTLGACSGASVNSPASSFRHSGVERRKHVQWDNFYKRNESRFFKDRHYLTKAFPELRQSLQTLRHVHVLEAGCGAANAVLPLLQKHTNLSATVVDYAARAVELVKAKEEYDGRRLQAYVRDICQDLRLPCHFHFATMIFVLSAVSPKDMRSAVENVVNALLPGGFLLFRDYGLGDMAQLRFDTDQALSHGFYVRQDGTCSFFFTLEGLRWLFVEQCGLEEVSAKYIRRKVVNHREQKEMLRVFVNACFRKPKPADPS